MQKDNYNSAKHTLTNSEEEDKVNNARSIAT